MREKLDLRVQKTYIALTNALWEMMNRMPFEEIRIQDLCDRAMVRKSTFYKHFADKYELLNFVVREKIAQYDAEISRAVPEDAPSDYYARCIDSAFDFIRRNEGLVRNSLNAGNSGSLVVILNALSGQIGGDLQKRLAENEREGYRLPASSTVLSAFFVGGMAENIRLWLIGGKKTDEAELRAQLKNLLRTLYFSSEPSAAQ